MKLIKGKKRLIAVIMMLSLLCACGGSKEPVELFPAQDGGVSTGQSGTVPEDNGPVPTDASVQKQVIEPRNKLYWAPEELETIPRAYFEPAKEQGKLVPFIYNTYEAFTYDQRSVMLEKRAFVYLPYDYDENKKYDIMYFMHGGGGTEAWLLGNRTQVQGFKNVIDHAIQDKRVKPMIIVCPTYRNAGYGEVYVERQDMAMKLCAIYYKELLNDLVPSVERHYSTYAEGKTDPESLKASRDHRCFGGFSNGSVACWYVFAHGTDYFRWFMPMSCGATLQDVELDVIASGLPKDSFFIYLMTGTKDFALACDSAKAQLMKNSPYYREYSSPSDIGNFVYRTGKGYVHGDIAAREYIYNGIQFFFGYG